mmetsp:Transcript_4852/g.5382  ORF Transcript_4852/g.5382 Transcript_4852/m.5382 type:complete len:534 (-) Transcript_4852:1040-2641(-)
MNEKASIHSYRSQLQLNSHSRRKEEKLEEAPPGDTASESSVSESAEHDDTSTQQTTDSFESRPPTSSEALEVENPSELTSESRSDRNSDDNSSSSTTSEEEGQQVVVTIDTLPCNTAIRITTPELATISCNSEVETQPLLADLKVVETTENISTVTEISPRPASLQNTGLNIVVQHPSGNTVHPGISTNVKGGSIIEERREDIQLQLSDEASRKKEERIRLQKQLDAEEELRGKRLIFEEQRKELIKQQHIEQLKRQRDEAEARLVRQKEEQRRRREEEKRRMEKQSQFPEHHSNQPFPNQMQHQNIGYHQQHQSHMQHKSVNQRSGTLSSGGETPMKRQNKYHFDDRSASNAPTLFYDRLVSEEVHELKEYARIIKQQDGSLADLRGRQEELEERLELKTNEKMKLEATLERQEGEWAVRCLELEKERDQWKKMVQAEQTKNERLLNFMNKKEQEIQRMIRRKYEPNQQGNQKASNPRALTDRPIANQRQALDKCSGPISHKSPHDFLQASSSVKAAQERQAKKSLFDFFGL